MDIISRANAAQIGARHFFTGRTCKNGHVAPRYVSTGNCTGCQTMFSKASLDSKELDGVIPTQRVHPADRDEILKIIDFFNTARGLPPAVRPGQLPLAPTPWEDYLAKELRRPFTARPSLESMMRAAGVLGIKVEYKTMTPPVDTWSTRNVVLPLASMSTNDPIIRAANEAHNAQLAAAAEAGHVPPDVAARKAEFAEALARDGYAPDEK